MAYTVGFLAVGKFVDRYGTRIGYTVSICRWSVAACLHAFARSAMQLGFWRGMLGLGEAGNFPAAIKSVAEWFPKKDRAFATGIFQRRHERRVDGRAAAFCVDGRPSGWRTCFLITGSIGFVLAVMWWMAYRLPEVHRSVNREELAYIQSDAAEEAKR